MMHFLNEVDVGNWSQTHPTMDSKFLAIPCAVEINSLGSMTFFDVVNTIDACRYSNLSLSSSLVIPSPVYILTCICIETQMNEMKCKNSCSYMKHPVLILAGVFISKNSKDLSTSIPRCLEYHCVFLFVKKHYWNYRKIQVMTILNVTCMLAIHELYFNSIAY